MLTDQQRQDRARLIGASDARRIMAGYWYEVWAEKTGRTPPPDLSQNILVQIGIATEPLHAELYAVRTGIPVVKGDFQTFRHPALDWACCHPDFLTWADLQFDAAAEWDTVMEAKFNAGFSTLEEVTEYNYWQLAHQMWVTGRSQAVLSLIQPRKDGYSYLRIERDETRIDQLVQALTRFWWHVETDVPPGNEPGWEAPAVQRMRVLDMSLNNHFTSNALTIIQNRPYVEASKTAESQIKADMPADASMVFLPGTKERAGLYLSRDKSGKISLRIGDPPAKARKAAEMWLPESFSEAGE